MEAGGFEPPSRYISGKASTCLVGYLNFALMYANRQADTVASPLSFTFASRTSAKAIPLSDVQSTAVRRAVPERAAYLGCHAQL